MGEENVEALPVDKLPPPKVPLQVFTVIIVVVIFIIMMIIIVAIFVIMMIMVMLGGRTHRGSRRKSR